MSVSNFLSSYEEQQALATRLQDYWHKQGYPLARFHVEWVFTFPGSLSRHAVILSNLKNGLPPK